MDGRVNNGAKPGENRGQGRKPKADEILLIEKLSAYDDVANEKLLEGVKEGKLPYLKLFYEYRYGKPKQQVDVTTRGDKLNSIPLVEWISTSNNDSTTNKV